MSPLQNIFTCMLAITTTNSMNISFDDVINKPEKYVDNYVIQRCWQYCPTTHPYMFFKPTIRTTIRLSDIATTSVKGLSITMKLASYMLIYNLLATFTLFACMSGTDPVVDGVASHPP